MHLDHCHRPRSGRERSTQGTPDHVVSPVSQHAVHCLTHQFPSTSRATTTPPTPQEPNRIREASRRPYCRRLPRTAPTTTTTHQERVATTQPPHACKDPVAGLLSTHHQGTPDEANSRSRDQPLPAFCARAGLGSSPTESRCHPLRCGTGQPMNDQGSSKLSSQVTSVPVQKRPAGVTHGVLAGHFVSARVCARPRLTYVFAGSEPVTVHRDCPLSRFAFSKAAFRCFNAASLLADTTCWSERRFAQNWQYGSVSG